MRSIWLRFGVAVLLLVLGLLPRSHAASAAYTPEQLRSDGEVRDYLVHRPTRPPAGAPGLVLLLHGHLGTDTELVGQGRNRAAPYRAWLAIAERENLILVAPQGLRGGDHRSGWNDCRGDAASNPQADDVAFLERIIDHMVADARVDPRRVYVVGTSNGGQMALRMAIERPQRVTAVAAIVAAMPAKSRCAAPTTFVPVLLMNGTADPLSPYEGGAMGVGGGERGTVLSTVASIDLWRRVGGYTAPGLTRQLADPDRSDDSRVVVTRYPAEGDPRLMLYRIDGGGHSEPSRTEHYARWYQRLTGPQNGDIEAAEEIWRFFALQVSPPRVPAEH